VCEQRMPACSKICGVDRQRCIRGIVRRYLTYHLSQGNLTLWRKDRFKIVFDVVDIGGPRESPFHFCTLEEQLLVWEPRRASSSVENERLRDRVEEEEEELDLINA
jgi:hypothetical protein